MLDEREDDLESGESINVEDMSQDDVVSPSQDTVTEEQNVPVSEVPQEQVKQEAKKTGHLSPEEYKAKYGSMEGYKTEEEFVQFGKLYPVLEDLKRTVQKRDREIEALVKYNENVKERERQAARKELEEALRQAREYGDIATVEELTKEKSKMEFYESQQQKERMNQERMQAVTNFQVRNKHWFNDQYPQLKARAEALDQEIMTGMRGPVPSTWEELGMRIESAMKQEYPDIVSVQSRPAPVMAAPQSSVNKAQSISEHSEEKVFKGLSQEYKDMYYATQRILKRSGRDYLVKQFIEKLKSDGEI